MEGRTLNTFAHDRERIFSDPESFDHARNATVTDRREYLNIRRKVRERVVFAATLRANDGDQHVRPVRATPRDIAMLVRRLAQLADGLVQLV